MKQSVPRSGPFCLSWHIVNVEIDVDPGRAIVGLLHPQVRITVGR